MGETRADETPPPVMLTEPLFIQTRSHAEGLRLAAAAKLPPPLICLRATRQLHIGRERETEGGGGEGE